MGPTAVGSSRGAEMVTFGGTPRSKVDQASSRDMKKPMVSYSLSQETTTCELADLNTLKRLLTHYLSLPQ